MEGLPQPAISSWWADRDKARGISEYREQKLGSDAAKSSRVSLEGLRSN